MKFYEAFLTGIALAMDAFTASIVIGTGMRYSFFKRAITISAVFGFFQGAMLFLGKTIGLSFSTFLSRADGLISFFILTFLGINMLKEKNSDLSKYKHGISIKSLIALAFATSIDAFAAGIAASLSSNAYQTHYDILVVGFITFFLCLFGVCIGKRFGTELDDHANIVGSCVLILLGIKALFEEIGLNVILF